MDTATLFISPHELRAAQAGADAPLLLDVRREPAFAASPRRLAAALRVAPEHVAEFARTASKRPVVVYCVYGHQVGAEAAQQLRAAGWDAQALAGGIEGGEPGVDSAEDIARWRAQPPLMLTLGGDPAGTADAEIPRWQPAAAGL